MSNSLARHRRNLAKVHRIYQKRIETGLQPAFEKHAQNDIIRQLESSYLEKQLILNSKIDSQRKYIEHLQTELAEYQQFSKQAEDIIKELNLEISSKQKRIDELDKWCGHLQAQIDKRCGFLCKVKKYLRHPISGIKFLLGKF